MGFKNIFTKKGSAGSASASSSGSSPTSSAASSPQVDATDLHSQSLGNITPINSGKTPSNQTPPVSLQVSRQNSTSSSIHSNLNQEGGSNWTRLISLPDGRHAHQLKNARRQEKLGRMLREIMGSGQRVGNNAVSAVPDFIKQTEQQEGRLTLMHGLVNRLANGEVEVGRVNGSSSNQDKRFSNAYENYEGPGFKETSQKSLAQKYGRCQEIIGRGSYGVVRVYHKSSNDGKEQLFAVKEFRKRGSESGDTYQDRLMSEFCISSSLDHLNIIHTYDLMKDSHGGCCQIMEYCSGGDLYSLVISSGNGLTAAEADCFFKQMLRGVVYMHSMGVAHCDLKPENILLTQNGVCKISDFGNGECFRMAWEKDVHYSQGICGSGPYIAPEEFKGKSFDPRAVDIWALGIIYMVMRTGSYLWRKAVVDEDDHYAKYIRARKTTKGYTPVEKLSPSKCVYVIYSILDPVPSRRISGKQILNSEWGRSIKVCEAAEKKAKLTKEQSQQQPSLEEAQPMHTTKAAC